MQPRPLKRFKRLVRYLLLRVVFALFGLLPLRVAISLGGGLGRFGFRLAGRERRKSLASLAIAFPELSEAQRYELGRRCFEHLGMCAGEVFCASQIVPQLERYVELPAEDEATLRAAVAEGRGVLYLTGHVGNFELMARRIAALGYPSKAIAKPASDPRLTAFIGKMRGDGKVGIIWRGRGTAVQQIEQGLAANELVGLLIDQDTRSRAHFVDFFGRPAHTPRIVADLALKRGAAVVAGFVFRRPDGGHRVRLERLVPRESGDFEADSRAFTQVLSDAIERAIREAPHAWVWMHQRWKTQPPAAGTVPPASDRNAGTEPDAPATMRASG